MMHKHVLSLVVLHHPVHNYTSVFFFSLAVNWNVDGLYWNGQKLSHFAVFVVAYYVGPIAYN